MHPRRGARLRFQARAEEFSDTASSSKGFELESGSRMLLPVAGLVITGGALADQPGTAPPGEIYTFLKLAKFSGEILLLLQICQAGLASNMGTFSSFM